MKIKIIKCSSPIFWYSHEKYFNAIFEVLELDGKIEHNLGYCVGKGKMVNNFVLRQDCEILEL